MKEVIHFDETDTLRSFVGPGDRLLRKLRKAFKVAIVARGNTVAFDGDDIEVANAVRAARRMLSAIRNRGALSDEEADSLIAEAAGTSPSSDPDALPVFGRGKFIVPRTPGQRRFVRALLDKTITFGIGPAGTGKTYLSVAVAVSMLRKGLVKRIVLVRPAVEAGEKLGFLPGDLREKVDPYLRPLYDSLSDMLDPDHLTRLMNNDVIEVAPLAFMRGRTLNRSFVILDEAQNCTVAQMKMFLTRLGNDSKAAITGDVTQSDLPGGRAAGLVNAHRILKDIPGIAFVVLSHADIVRHPLVQRIVDAYESYESRRAGGEPNGEGGEGA